MRARKPPSAFRTGTRRSRRSLRTKLCPRGCPAEPSPAPSLLFSGQNPHQSFAKPPRRRAVLLQDQRKPDGRKGPGTGSVPRPRPRPLPASTGSPRNANLTKFHPRRRASWLRCAPSPWCAASASRRAAQESSLCARESPPPPEPEPRGRRDKAWRLARWRRWLTVAAAAAGSGATYPAGARSGGAKQRRWSLSRSRSPGGSGAGCRLSVRPPPPLLPRRAAPPAGPERGARQCSTLPSACPRTPPLPARIPGYLSARWQLGGGEGGHGNKP